MVIDFNIDELESPKRGPKAQKTFINNLDSRDYILAYKFGFLLRQASHMFSRTWENRFYVLCNIGLVYMQKPYQKEIKLFPFMDFKIVEVPYS